ncbi:MAG: single-stranded DNA-binding protein [SAR202 cluster bacterium]|nr:single-stranded DNA-binding protein [SAR202 cluster bacterium]|tara:strand:- start:376 stop:741 length:366 start_codon:yes stop_codon:yes gene_type:complete
MNINQLVVAGRLTKDAENSQTQKGTSMSKFRLAVNDRRNDDTLFLNVLCFGKMAEALGPHLNKGLLVGVQGKLKIDDYEDKEGVKRTSVCVMADDISLGPKNGDGASKSKSSESSDESVPF